MNFKRLIASAASLLAAGLSACADPPPLYGDSTNVPGNNMPTPMAMPDMAMDPYPEGPYGNQEGDTMFDIDLPGYRLSLDHTDITEVPWEDSITLSSVRAQSKAKCIWLALDAFW